MSKEFLWIACFGLVLLATPAQADNWTQFRGPNADGLAKESQLPTEWGKDKNVQWQVEESTPLPFIVDLFPTLAEVAWLFHDLGRAEEFREIVLDPDPIRSPWNDAARAICDGELVRETAADGADHRFLLAEAPKAVGLRPMVVRVAGLLQADSAEADPLAASAEADPWVAASRPIKSTSGKCSVSTGPVAKFFGSKPPSRKSPPSPNSPVTAMPRKLPLPTANGFMPISA